MADIKHFPLADSCISWDGATPAEREHARLMSTGEAEPIDAWVPACGGTEIAFRTRTGLRVLYVWNPKEGRHGYLNLDTDILLSDAEQAEARL